MGVGIPGTQPRALTNARVGTQLPYCNCLQMSNQTYRLWMKLPMRFKMLWLKEIRKSWRCVTREDSVPRIRSIAPLHRFEPRQYRRRSVLALRRPMPETMSLIWLGLRWMTLLHGSERAEWMDQWQHTRLRTTFLRSFLLQLTYYRLRRSLYYSTIYF